MNSTSSVSILRIVMPAQAGIQDSREKRKDGLWTPAFAGVTPKGGLCAKRDEAGDAGESNETLN